MTQETLCNLHYVPNCGLCRKSAPIQVNPAVPTQADSVPDSGTTVPVLSTPDPPKFSSPQAALALKLAEAFELVSQAEDRVNVLTRGLAEAQNERNKAVAERDRIQGELMPVRKAELRDHTPDE